MANTRMKPYHVLGSTYRIGDGSKISLIPICVIYYGCTDSSGNIFACTRLHAGLRWWLLRHRHLKVDIWWMPPHTSSIWPWSGAPTVHLYGTFMSGLRQTATATKKAEAKTMEDDIINIDSPPHKKKKQSPVDQATSYFSTTTLKGYMVNP